MSSNENILTCPRCGTEHRVLMEPTVYPAMQLCRGCNRAFAAPADEHCLFCAHGVTPCPAEAQRRWGRPDRTRDDYDEELAAWRRARDARRAERGEKPVTRPAGIWRNLHQ